MNAPLPVSQCLSAKGTVAPLIVITNVFGSFNRGDALLVEALHDSIRAAAGEDANLAGVAHFPRLEAQHLPDVEWHLAPGKSYQTSAVRRRIDNIRGAIGVTLYALFGAPRWLRAIAAPEQLAAVDAIKRADVVVSCAGGFLIDTNMSIFSNLLQLLIAHRFRKPVVLAPQTIGPIKRNYLRPILRGVLNRAHIVCSRERFTDAFLKDLGIKEGKVIRLTDLALYHKRVDPEAGERAARELGVRSGEEIIGCSVLRWSFPRSADPVASKARYLNQICETISDINRRTGLRVLLVNQVSSDLEVGREVARRLGEVVILDTEDRSPAEMRGLIRRCKSFVGSRFHSCVFSILERVPTTALAYNYKSNGIMQDLGLADRVYDIDGFDPGEVADWVSRDLADRPRQVNRIETGLDKLSYPKFEEVLRRVVCEVVAQ